MNEVTTFNQELITYSPDQVKLIKDMYAKKATDDELKVLMYMSNKYSLDILTKQIWCVKFGEAAAQIYAGRDGFLEIGHRSGKFNGIETKTVKVNEPLSINYLAWENRVRVEKTFKSDFQFVSTCTVFRKDMDHPISVEVYEEEYSTGQSLWQSKRRTMIGKVAESQALRKAFSISGIYSQEEMNTNDVIVNENKPTVEEIIEVDTITHSIIDKNKVDAIIALAKRKGIIQHSVCAAYGIETFEEMTFEVWNEATEKLNLRPDKKVNPLDGVI